MNPHIEQLDLEQDTGAPRRARHFLSAVLTSWGLPSETVETSQLLASELVSNAVLHGRAPINMSIKVADPQDLVIRVEVSNDGEGVPTLRIAARSDPSGRGLKLIEDLSRRWGSSTIAGHTCVWFEISA